MTGTLLGLDIGSSAVKGTLIDAASGKVLTRATSPKTEMSIHAAQPGWAEQHPDVWWEHVCNVIHQIGGETPNAVGALRAIGIAYQMHGLVLVDRDGAPVRPAIIWCDSRAVALGAGAFEAIGHDVCLSAFGNSPGNFTAAKLAWVKRNEPENLSRAAYFMLPGDYIALRLTGRFGTTTSGLSEGVLWDFSKKTVATAVLSHFELPLSLVPPVGENIGAFAEIRAEVARELGLPAGVAVTYRAGDQPNNALALNVLNPGEVAANAGTSGVVYGVTSELGVDPQSRVNNFLHVTSSTEAQRIGVLMCVNGAGSFYRWVKNTLSPSLSYEQLNALAGNSPVGSNGLVALPYGNGAERTLGNLDIGASLSGIQLNRHTLADISRAAQEGVVFSLCYGIEIMQRMGLTPKRVRAANANMFQSEVFRRSFANATGVPLDLYTTDGAEGAARGAGIGLGVFSPSEAYRGLQIDLTLEPEGGALREATQQAYEHWKQLVAREATENR
jgi:xylulokinase